MAKLFFTLILTTTPHNSIRSDEGLTLETSAFLIFPGGNSTFINSFDKTKFLFKVTFHLRGCLSAKKSYARQFRSLTNYKS